MTEELGRAFWELVTVDDDVPRAATEPEGRPITLRSTVVRAVRG